MLACYKEQAISTQNLETAMLPPSTVKEQMNYYS